MKYFMKIFSKIVFYIFIFSNFSYGLNVGVTKIPQNDTLNIREEPKLGAKKIGELAFNAALINVYDCENTENKKGPKEWCQIEYRLNNPMDEYNYNVKNGWVAKKYLSFAPYRLQQQKKYRYKTYKIIRHQPGEFLNVRIGRGSQYEIIDKLPYNKKDIKIKSCLKTKNGDEWCWINYPIDHDDPYLQIKDQNREGWVSAKYLVPEQKDSKQILKIKEEKIDTYTNQLIKKEIGKPFVQIGHLSNVVTVAFSPDDNYILSASEDGTLILWDAYSLKEIHTFMAGSHAVTSASFSPNGKYIVSAGEDETLKLWDVKNGDLLKVFRGHSRGVNTVDFSPDGREIISGSKDETLILWNIESGKALRVYKGHEGSVLSVAFSPDGKQIVSGSWNGTTILWDKDDVTPVQLFEGNQKYSAHVFDVAFSPDGRFIASATGDSTIQVWDRVSVKKVNTFKGHRGAVRAIAFSPDGNYLLSGAEDHTLKLWDLYSGVEIKSYVGHKEVVTAVAFSPDGNFILSGSLDDTLKLWDRESGEVLKSSEKSVNVTLNSRFILNKNKILASYDDHTLKAWGLDKAQLVQEYLGHSGKVWNFELLLEGEQTVSGDDDGNIIHWNLTKNTKIREFKQYDRYSNDEIFIETIDSLSICENDHYMITRGPTNVYFWDLKNDKLMLVTDHYSYAFLDGVYPPIFNAISYDEILSNHKINYDKYVQFLESINEYDKDGNSHLTYISIGFSKNNNIILYNKPDGSLEFWDIQTQQLSKKVNCSKNNNEKIKFSLSINNKGALVVSNADSHKELVKFYSFKDGEWISITPEGYFNASENGAKYLNVLTGPMSVTSVDAYYETFYRPDIVKATLAGKTIDTGLAMQDIKPAPEVQIVNTPSKINQDEISVTLNITEKGGGVGDIRLYLNGVAVKTDSRAIVRKQSKKSIQKHFTLKLPTGKHTIKAVVFNESNTMRSNEAEHTVMAEYTVIHQPELHALIIGVNEFKNPKLQLKYATDDAILFADTIKEQSKGLFSKTVIHQLDTKEQTTKEAITQKLIELQSLNPDDLFVFYVASHGTVDDGEYFLLTSNVGSTSTTRLKSDAIQQIELKRLIANVPTTKKFIVLDTCNAGAMGNALLTRGMSEDTAMKVLSRAVGSTILAAATSQQEALEGYRGHGLFTYVLTEGLKGKADMDKDGYVKTLEIANYIDEKVPEIAEREFNRAQYPVVSPSGQAFPVSRMK